MSQSKRISLKNLDTYVYIDVSNIRWACVKTLNFHIDFVKLLDYFKNKYPNLKDVRYYEGIARGDQKKRKMFDFLRKKGYTICALERKSYNSVETEERNITCPSCNYKWTAAFTKEHRAMKSNVDVYLASDMVAQVSQTARPIRIVLVSCDGDYAEALKTMIRLNKNVSIGVLATPYVKDRQKNTFSKRLQEVRNGLKPEQYMVHNISDLRTSIESDKIPL